MDPHPNWELSQSDEVQKGLAAYGVPLNQRSTPCAHLVLMHARCRATKRSPLDFVGGDKCANIAHAVEACSFEWYEQNEASLLQARIEEIKRKSKGE